MRRTMSTHGHRARSATAVAVAVVAVLAGIVAAPVSASRQPNAITVNSFTRNFAAMQQLRSITKAGTGSVAAILPDTTTSARYTAFDQPFLITAMQVAGLSASQIVVQNALGSDSTELTLAQSDISSGARVLIMDPLDSGVGAQIERYAKAHGVPVVDYDRLTLGGSRAYYVSFNNVQVGKLIGQGFVACVNAWHVKKPQVAVMHGAVTDNNATLFAQGYMSVLQPYFKSGKYVDVVNTAGTWDAPTALTEFQQAFRAHPNINSAVIPNDETGAPIITYLQTLHIKPRTFPTTGQDATLVGLDNVLTGYQCGTVYKPIYEEAQAAVAVALYLRAHKTPPAALINGRTLDSKLHKQVPSVLLTPEWVTTKNMNKTVIADSFVPAFLLCAGQYASACRAAGIKS